MKIVEDDCDQGFDSTKHCTKWECQEGFDKKGKPIRPLLEKKGFHFGLSSRQTYFWCCPSCGASYGKQPHPDFGRCK